MLSSKSIDLLVPGEHRTGDSIAVVNGASSNERRTRWLMSGVEKKGLRYASNLQNDNFVVLYRGLPATTELHQGESLCRWSSSVERMLPAYPTLAPYMGRDVTVVGVAAERWCKGPMCSEVIIKCPSAIGLPNYLLIAQVPASAMMASAMSPCTS